MAIENIQDLISIVRRKVNHEEKIFIVTGPIMFARVSCCSPFKPYVTASTKTLKFDKAGFVTKTKFLRLLKLLLLLQCKLDLSFLLIMQTQYGRCQNASEHVHVRRKVRLFLLSCKIA